jgi:hypothetical protein
VYVAATISHFEMHGQPKEYWHCTCCNTLRLCRLFPRTFQKRSRLEWYLSTVCTIDYALALFRPVLAVTKLKVKTELRSSFHCTPPKSSLQLAVTVAQKVKQYVTQSDHSFVFRRARRCTVRSYSDEITTLAFRRQKRGRD